MEPTVEAEKTPPAGEPEVTEETPAVEAEGAPAEGEAVEASEKPPEGEEKPAEAKPLNELTVEELTAQLTEAQLTKVAQKFSNKTMAAARRAEREVETVRGANEKLTGEIATYRGFVDQMGSDPMTALRRLPGFTTLKEFVQRCVGSTAAAEPKPLDEIAALRKRLDDREKADQHRVAEAQNQASQERVFAALEKEPERFDLVLTDDGRPRLWRAIADYRDKHGRVPNDKVFEMAEAIEERMTASLAKSKKFFAQAQSAKTGDSAAANARPAASKTGAKTITNRSSSSGIVVRDYSRMTEKERDAAILADMKASGEL